MEEKDLLNLRLAKEAIEEYLSLAEKIKTVLRKNDGKIWARKIPDEIQALSPCLVVCTTARPHYADQRGEKVIHIDFATQKFFLEKISPKASLSYKPSLIYICGSESIRPAREPFLREQKYIRAEAMSNEIDNQVDFWQKKLQVIAEEVENPESVTDKVKEYVETLEHAEEIWKSLSDAAQTIFANGHKTELYNFPYLNR